MDPESILWTLGTKHEHTHYTLLCDAGSSQGTMGALVHTQRQFNIASPPTGKFFGKVRRYEKTPRQPTGGYVKLHTDSNQWSGLQWGPWSAILLVCNIDQTGRTQQKGQLAFCNTLLVILLRLKNINIKEYKKNINMVSCSGMREVWWLLVTSPSV